MSGRVGTTSPSMLTKGLAVIGLTHPLITTRSSRMIARVAVWDPMPNDDRQWVIDAAKTVPGVLDGYHLVDPTAGNGLSIAFFEDTVDVADVKAAIGRRAMKSVGTTSHAPHPNPRRSIPCSAEDRQRGDRVTHLATGLLSFHSSCFPNRNSTPWPTLGHCEECGVEMGGCYGHGLVSQPHIGMTPLGGQKHLICSRSFTAQAAPISLVGS